MYYICGMISKTINETHTSAKQLLGVVKLVLLRDYDVVAKEVVTIKPIAYLCGFFWKYNIMFYLKRDFIIADA